MLQTMHPDRKWTIKEYKQDGYFNSIDNQKKFMLDVEKKLYFKQRSDWYNVTTRQLIDLGGIQLLRYCIQRSNPAKQSDQ